MNRNILWLGSGQFRIVDAVSAFDFCQSIHLNILNIISGGKGVAGQYSE